MRGIYSEDEISSIIEREVVTLIVLINTEMTIDDPEPPLKFFSVPVAIEKNDFTEGLAIQPLKDQVARTRIFLEEYHIELYYKHDRLKSIFLICFVVNDDTQGEPLLHVVFVHPQIH